MEPLEGLQIQDFGFILQRKGDLLYHDGPLLSHFINEENDKDHYLYKWTDMDDKYNRWMVFKITEADLLTFLQSNIKLLELIYRNPFVFFVDLDNDLNINSLTLCRADKIPADYLPSQNSFYNEKHYEEYAAQLKEALTEKAISKHYFERILAEITDLKKEMHDLKKSSKPLLINKKPNKERKVLSSNDITSQSEVDNVMIPASKPKKVLSSIDKMRLNNLNHEVMEDAG